MPGSLTDIVIGAAATGDVPSGACQATTNETT